MAVYTDLTAPRYHRQFKAIEAAFEFRIARIEPIAGGSTDSKFRIETTDHAAYVLTIHESPAASVAGVSLDAAKRTIRYTEYLADALPAMRDRRGKPIEVCVVKPLRSVGEIPPVTPFLEVDFDGELRLVTIVEYVEGKAYQNHVDEIIEPWESHLAGRALAACFRASQNYLDAWNFKNYDFAICVEEIDRLGRQPVVIERLNYLLAKEPADTLNGLAQGSDYLTEMRTTGQELLSFWRLVKAAETDYGLIHGDFFTDNTILRTDNMLVAFDFSQTTQSCFGMDVGTALNSWGAINCSPRVQNTLEFLSGVDSVYSLPPELFAMLPHFAELGALRWETFRVQRLERQDPRRHTLRSPVEFLNLRHAWRRMQPAFAHATSLKTLSQNLLDDSI